ncbi:MAG: DUF2330 domain-containing protein [Polyangiaceae bacterium]|nr:DUF2330 domain-containing protein [Polyangiaceae bacterium]
MRALASFVAFVLVLSSAATALPCGAPFGDEIRVEPDQKIVVGYHAGIETYVFGPRFCGKASAFGLVLPVPTPLSASPALAAPELFHELDALSAPTVQIEYVCADESGEGLGCGTAASDKALAGGNQGVNVIDAGRVGDFDWVQVQADTQAAFTDWLDANGYPYPAGATAVFDHYVGKGWYFVAFKFATTLSAPPPGSEVCGDLGPFALEFPTPEPVVPARITAAGAMGSLVWDVYTLTAEQQRALPDPGILSSELRYAWGLAAADLADLPEVATLAVAGDHVTRLRLTIEPSWLADDLAFAVEPAPGDFRATDIQYVTRSCDGCSVRAGSGARRLPAADLLLWLGALALACRTGRRRAREQAR